MPRKMLALLVAAFAVGLVLAFFLKRTDENLGSRLSQNSANPNDAAETPERIALLSTAAEEVLVALHADDLIVGTTGFSAFLKDHPNVQKIGGVMDINFEMLSKLRPDLIIAQTKDPRLERFSAERRIRFMRIDIEKITDVLDLSRNLGRIVGRAEAGRALAADIEGAIARLRAQSATTEKLPCFVTVDRSPGHMTQILTTGRTTFVNELLEIAGCRNIFDDMDARYPTVSKESLMARAPEVIIELKPSIDPPPTLASDMQEDWQLLGGIPAVAHRRIHVIFHPDALIAGPKMAEVAAEIAQALHPKPDAGTTAPDDRR